MMHKMESQLAAGVLPSLNRIDLVFNYTNFLLKLFRTCRDTIIRHKIKTIVVLLGFYAAHKTFGVYKSLKNALNPLAGLQELGVDEDQTEPSAPAQVNLEQEKVKAYLKSDPLHLLQLKIFQSSQKNVLENLPKQVSFVTK